MGQEYSWEMPLLQIFALKRVEINPQCLSTEERNTENMVVSVNLKQNQMEFAI